MIFEHTLEDRPVAVQTIFDTLNKPNLNIIAIAVASSIVYIKDFEAYMKFELPQIEFSNEESEIWGDLIKLTGNKFG